MTTTDAGPPAVLLPGQAAAPAGPCDLSGMYLMHHGFRRDLRDLEAAARHTPTDDAATWQALRERWERFSHLLHEHHAVEDRVLWPLLRERVGAADDDAGLEVLAAMEAEHELIDPLLAQIATLIAAPAPDPDRLAAALSEAATVLDDHLGHEERDAVALMQRYVDGKEWEVLEKREFRGRPSPGELRFQLPWMVHEVPDDVVRAMVKAAGPVFAMLLATSRRSFLKRQRAAFRYVP